MTFTTFYVSQGMEINPAFHIEVLYFINFAKRTNLHLQRVVVKALGPN